MRIGLLKRWLRGMPELKSAIAAEKGPFSLFALIEKEDWDEYEHTIHSWRLYVAAPWIWKDDNAAEKYLREQIRHYEDPLDFRAPTIRVEVVKPTHRYLEEVWEYCSTENGMVEVYDVDILDVTARRGYIFAAQRPDNFDEIRQAALLEEELRRQRYDQNMRERREARLQAQYKNRATA